MPPFLYTKNIYIGLHMIKKITKSTYIYIYIYDSGFLLGGRVLGMKEVHLELYTFCTVFLFNLEHGIFF